MCESYTVDGKKVSSFPYGDALQRATPNIVTKPGWQCDISHCRRFEDLPAAARDYVQYLEEAVACPIRYVSVGAEREAIIRR